MTADTARGRHGLHLHADEFHFTITVGHLLAQAARANAQVRWHLPRRLERALQRVARAQTVRARPDWLLPFPCPAKPDAVRAEALHALQDAIAAGYAGLWLVLSLPEGVENEAGWREAEVVFTELCGVHPLVVLCSYPTFDPASRPLLNAAPGCHSHYYLGGEFRPIGDVFPEVRSRAQAPGARARA